MNTLMEGSTLLCLLLCKKANQSPESLRILAITDRLTLFFEEDFHVGNRSVTTLEGLPSWYARQHKLKQVPLLTPVQQAFIDEQAIQCG